MSILKKSLNNGSAFIFNSAVIALWYYLLTQRAPAEEAGIVLLAISTAAMINLLDLGSSLCVLRLVTDKNRADFWPDIDVAKVAIFGCAIIEAVVGGAALFFATYIGWIRLDWGLLLWITSFAVTTQMLLTLASAFKAFGLFGTANLVSMAAASVVYGLSSVLLILGVAPRIAFVVMALGQLACVIYAVRSFFVQTRLGRHKSRLAGTKSWTACYFYVLRQSIEFFPQIFSGVFFLHIQRFLILHYLGIGAVANYSFAYAIASRLHGVLNAFFELLFPFAAELVAKSRSVMLLCVKYGAIAAVLCITGSLFAGLVIHYIAPHVLEIFIWYVIGIIFAMMMAPAFHVLNGLGRMRFVSFCSLLTPVVFVLAVTGGAQFSWRRFDLLIPGAYAAAMLVLLLALVTVLRRLQHERSN